jgi:hypothetical protein
VADFDLLRDERVSRVTTGLSSSPQPLSHPLQSRKTEIGQEQAEVRSLFRAWAKPVDARVPIWLIMIDRHVPPVRGALFASHELISE